MDIRKIEDQKIKSDFNDKFITYDITYLHNGNKKPWVLFVHGFKGFKDWGHFPLIAEEFAKKGFVFIKLNLSHNGTTPEALQEFDDLEAFGNNNFTKELADIKKLVDHIFESNVLPATETALDQFNLIGHSKGGASSIIYATMDKRLQKLVTRAALCHIYDRYTHDEAEEWEKNGVQYIFNSRTNQNMPLYYQLAEDLISNKAQYNIPEVAHKINIPFLIIHGSDDETVALQEGKDIHELVPHSILEIVSGADHTFSGKHPWEEENLPKDAMKISQMSCDFLLK